MEKKNARGKGSTAVLKRLEEMAMARCDEVGSLPHKGIKCGERETARAASAAPKAKRALMLVTGKRR